MSATEKRKRTETIARPLTHEQVAYACAKHFESDAMFGQTAIVKLEPVYGGGGVYSEDTVVGYELTITIESDE